MQDDHARQRWHFDNRIDPWWWWSRRLPRRGAFGGYRAASGATGAGFGATGWLYGGGFRGGYYGGYGLYGLGYGGYGLRPGIRLRRLWRLRRYPYYSGLRRATYGYPATPRVGFTTQPYYSSCNPIGSTPIINNYYYNWHPNGLQQQSADLCRRCRRVTPPIRITAADFSGAAAATIESSQSGARGSDDLRLVSTPGQQQQSPYSYPAYGEDYSGQRFCHPTDRTDE